MEDKVLKTGIAIPCMNMVHTEFLTSIMALKRPGDVRSAIVMSSLIYDARNSLTKRAIEEGFDRVLWLDSDMAFESDTLVKLGETMDEYNADYVSGLYFARKPITHPIIYKELIYDINQEKQTLDARAIRYDDYPRDSVFEIAASGFGCVLIKTSALEAVHKVYGQPFSPMPGYGEDITFCWRMANLGMKMYCDSRVKLGHVGSWTVTEANYEAQRAEAVHIDGGMVGGYYK